MFPLASGHFASPWVPSMRSIVQKHPELNKKTAAVSPVHDEWLGGPANGRIEKLSPERLHAEIELFAKIIHKMDTVDTFFKQRVESGAAQSL
jgi:hypothetical protein